MNGVTKAFYLVFRTSTGNSIDWTSPIGGLVVPVEFKEHAQGVAQQRYHAAPWEHLILAEVWELEEAAQAQWLHQQWEADVMELNEQWA